MKVRADSRHRVTHDGHEVGFCSAGCGEKFRAEPAKFTGKAKVEPSASTPPVAPGAVYTCPMHPDIREDRPGACPKCGMALELASRPAATPAEGTCPMHPDIVRDAPGRCPSFVQSLESRSLNMFTLIGLGVSVAYVYSAQQVTEETDQ